MAKKWISLTAEVLVSDEILEQGDPDQVLAYVVAKFAETAYCKTRDAIRDAQANKAEGEPIAPKREFFHPPLPGEADAFDIGKWLVDLIRARLDGPNGRAR